jgi:hypothetical protein
MANMLEDFIAGLSKLANDYSSALSKESQGRNYQEVKGQTEIPVITEAPITNIPIEALVNEVVRQQSAPNRTMKQYIASGKYAPTAEGMIAKTDDEAKAIAMQRIWNEQLMNDGKHGTGNKKLMTERGLNSLSPETINEILTILNGE